MKKAVVTAPVTDLRKEPVPLDPTLVKDPLQETQLLFGEPLMVYEEKDDWVRVEAIEQKKFLGNGVWQGYPGWVKSGDITEVEEHVTPNIVVIEPKAKLLTKRLKRQIFLLSFGTHLYSLGVENGYHTVLMPNGDEALIPCESVQTVQAHHELVDRCSVTSLASQFVGQPYLWGGRSYKDAHSTPSHYGVDCSGLIHLLYSSQGIFFPRNAACQFLKCRRCSTEEIKEGDLIFSTKEESDDQIDHVMLYCGNGKILEASADAGGVRTLLFEEKFGVPLEAIQGSQSKIDNKTVYFTTFK